MRTQRVLRSSALMSTLVLALASAGVAQAGVSAAEAAKLKGELTPMGAEKAGNKDGTIPAWDGGYTKVPAGYKSGQPRPDPFAADKKLYSISAANLAQYADKLTDGQQALLKKYPSYRIDVYPTRRSAAAPQHIYDNTFKNATRAKLSADGNSVESAYGGIPFPIPKNGNEAIWNHQLRWQGESVLYFAGTYLGSGGKVVLASNTRNEMGYPYHYKDGSLENFSGESWLEYQVTTAPSFKAGETILVRDPIDYIGKGRQAWQYLVGQRRVRKAPNIAYDTPNTVTSGADFFDEVALFLGAPDRYTWKLLGKKEMLIPYNLNSFHTQPVDKVVGAAHLNPDHLRWELHRVWVVEADLAPGKRHVIPKRKFYLDEDTWNAALSDGWDAQGQLWHSGVALPVLAYEFPGMMSSMFAMYDVIKGSYSATVINGQSEQWAMVDRWPESNFTPESVAARGVR